MPDIVQSFQISFSTNKKNANIMKESYSDLSHMVTNSNTSPLATAIRLAGRAPSITIRSVTILGGPRMKKIC